MFGLKKKKQTLKTNTVHFVTDTGLRGQTDMITHVGVNTASDIASAEEHLSREYGLTLRITNVGKTRDFTGNINTVNKNKKYNGPGY